MTPVPLRWADMTEEPPLYWIVPPRWADMTEEPPDHGACATTLASRPAGQPISWHTGADEVGASRLRLAGRGRRRPCGRRPPLWTPPPGRPPGEDRVSRLGQAKTAAIGCVGAQSIPPIFGSIKSGAVDHREYYYIRSVMAQQARPRRPPPHRVLLTSVLSPWRAAAEQDAVRCARRLLRPRVPWIGEVHSFSTIGHPKALPKQSDAPGVHHDSFFLCLLCVSFPFLHVFCF